MSSKERRKIAKWKKKYPGLGERPCSTGYWVRVKKRRYAFTPGPGN